jgi:hypothetical protein
MLCLITFRRLAQGILLLHRYLLYHPSVLPSLHEFLFNVQNIKYTQALIHCTVHKISFPKSLYFPKLDSGQESYVRFTSAMKSVLKYSERGTLNGLSITPCTSLQTRWFLMRWNNNLVELLNISFSSSVHL